MKVRIGAALVAALLVAADPQDDVKKEREKFSGTWVVRSFETDGKAIDALKGTTFAFDGEKFTSKVPDQKSAGGTYKLDPSKELKEIDLLVNRVGGGKTTTRAVYAFDGHELRIYAAATTVATDPRGKVTETIGPRPTTTNGRTGAIITLTREK